MKIQSDKVGAVFYLLWSVLHVLAGASLLQSALTDINGHLREIGTAASPQQVPTLAEGSVVSAILAFHSFNMLWLGLLVGSIAVVLNWRGSRAGFWLNLALTGFLDLGLYLFLVRPGYMAWGDALIGPLLFILGAAFTAVARVRPVWTPALAASSIGPHG